MDVQVPAAATALIVSSFQILSPMLVYVRDIISCDFERLRQELYLVLVATGWHVAVIGLALRPQGEILLATHLPFSFRLPLVAATASCMVVMSVVVDKIRFPHRGSAASSAGHPAEAICPSA